MAPSARLTLAQAARVSGVELPAGTRLLLSQDEAGFVLRAIHLPEDTRNAGIGSRFVKALMALVEQDPRLTLTVTHVVNPGFFDKLGLAQLDEDVYFWCQEQARGY